MTLDDSAEMDMGGLSTSALRKLNLIAGLGLDEDALIIYGRWWQLESWLRELTYVELKAKYGSLWPEKAKKATGWQNKDAEWTHMLGRDTDNLLSYLDFSQLHDLMTSEWELFGPTMPRQASWNGQVDDLLRVRHRVAHFRYPHRDDLGRIEQALRDMERGAFIAAASFNSRWNPDPKRENNPLVRDWILREGSDARRLIDHAERQYDVSMEIRRSRRPWIGKTSKTDQPGWVWHVEFYSSRGVNIPGLWADDYFAEARDLLLLLEADSSRSLMLSFAAADDLKAISDTLGNVFEAVLHNRSHQDPASQIDPGWHAGIRRLSYKATAGSAWTITERATVPISLFGTGAVTTEVPNW